MYKLLTSKGQLIAIIIGVLSVAISLGSIISGVKSKYSMSEDLNAIMKSNPEASFDFFNPAISVVMFLVIVAAAAAILFGLFSLVTDPKGSIKFLLGFAGVALLFFILYSTADAESTGRLAMLTEKFNVSDNVSKLITGGVKTVVISIGFAFIAAVVMEILNLFK